MVTLWGHYDSTWGADCGYYVGLGGDGTVSLGKRVAGVNTTLGSPVSVSGGITAGTWYDVKLEMIGTTINAYVNGTLLVTQTDTSCDGGSTGVGSVGASFEADNVQVTAPSTNSCVQSWQTSTCGAFCTGQTQPDRASCSAYLDCYAAHGCSPETCGSPDDICGVNQPGLNTWGTAGKAVADEVFKCIACPGNINCANPKYPAGTACADGDPCTENDQCTTSGTCVGTPKQCDPPPNTQCYEAAVSCANDTCVYTKKADYTPYDDGDPDTREDSCHNGTCMGASVVNRVLAPDQADTVQSELQSGFSVSADGAATYVIPLDIPEGRAGISPKLALSYNSNGGNGIVGMGWSLTGATSQITRCPRIHAVDGESFPVTYGSSTDSYGVTTYSDRFCLDGDYLVAPESPTISASGVIEYRPEHNPSVRVTMSANGLSFLVEYPDGTKYTYGWLMGAKIQNVQANHQNFDPTLVTVANPTNYAWLLSKVSDLAGNTMTITYADHGSSNSRPGSLPDTVSEMVPDTIAYTSFVTNGATTTQALRKVVFGYSTRPDPSGSWVSGVHLGSTQLLKTITVSGPNPVTSSMLWTYTLSYENDSVSGRSLLNSVQQCDSNSVCKPATTFNWEKGASTFTEQSITSEQRCKAAIKIADLNGDGLPDLICTANDGSDQIIVFLASQSDTGLSYHQIASAGISNDNGENDHMAAVTPIDIRGGGAADLAVRQSESGKLWLRFYRFNGVSFDQLGDPNNYESPDNVDEYIYVADLDGDGLPELIRNVAGPWEYRKNNNGSLGPYAPLGGPNTVGGTFNITATHEYNNFVGDLDGSGRSTLLLMTDPTGVDTRYGQLSLTTAQRSANGIALSPSTVPWIARNHQFENGMGKVLLDLNGDGLPDAVDYPAYVTETETKSSNYFVNTGIGMIGGSTVSTAPGTTPNFSEPITNLEKIYSDGNGQDVFIVMDVNQDGRDDLVSAPLAGEDMPLSVFLSNGVGLSEPTTISYNSTQGGGSTITWDGSTTFHSFDANGDGLADFIMGYQVYLHDGKKADMITSFNNGGGSSVVVTYSPWTRTVDQSNSTDCKYPVRCPARGGWVVSDYHLDLKDASASPPKYTYSYDLPASDMLGRGWLGFGTRSVTYENSGQVTSFVTANTYRRGTSYPYAFRPGTVQNQVVLESGVQLTGMTNTNYDLINGNIDVPGHSFAFGPISSSYMESETADSGKGATTPFRWLDTTTNYDAYGNVYQTTRMMSDGSTDASVVTHLNDTTNWILSPPTLVQSSSISTGSGNGAYVNRYVKYDYATALPRSLTKVTVQPDGDATQHLEISVTGWSQFGLPQAADAVDLNGTHRTASIQYDDLEGSQPTVVTDPAGHKSSTVYHKGLNLPIWTMDFNGLVTNLYYYPFGRLQSVVLPDNNTQTMSYITPPTTVGGVLQLVRTMASGQVDSKVLDLLGRPISKSWLAMNGKTASTQTTYDTVFLSKPSKVTVPEFTDDTTTQQSTSLSYDKAGRLLTVNTPDGRTGQNQYSGLKTTTTDPKGNQSYSMKDDLGRITKHVSVMSASDVGGAR